MQKRNVKTPSDALLRITDCNMATVSKMAGKKSRAKCEYVRQISIAQEAIDYMKAMDIDMKDSRAGELNGKTVAEWAKEYEA